MANIYMNNSSSAFGIPEQAKLDFWVSNAHLTEEQRQKAWSASLYHSNAYDPAQSTMAHQIPRTMPVSMSNLTQLPVWTSSLVVALPMF